MLSELSKEECDRIVKRLGCARQNLKWVVDNFQTLKREYANEYIAVCNGQVMASGTRRNLVQKEAVKKVPDPDCITIKKIEPEKKVLIL